MARKNIGRVLSDGRMVLCVVLLCALNVSVQAAIEGQMVTYAISGSVGLSGVTMNGLPNTVTDENGYYSAVVKYGWSGTVTPVMAGYTFEPQKRTYPKVTSDQSNQDYTATLKTFTISGTARIGGAPMEGVAMEGLPGNPITGSDGAYKTIVNYGWSGSATPIKDGYIFAPNTKSYTVVIRDMPNQSYTGALLTFTISGSAEVEGITMNGLPGNPKTGRNGMYSTIVKFGWSGTVKPAKQGYTFEPAEMPYIDVISSYLNQDYAAIVDTFTISGTTGMDGVEMKGLPGAAVFTDENGYYTASVEWGWSSTVKPEKAGYKFEPATMTYTKLTSDKANQIYSPTPIILTISGSAGKQGVTMDGLPGNPVTRAGGLYSAKVDWGWTGMVTPMLDGYEFTPTDMPYAAITTSQKNRNYTAKEIIFTISGSVGVSGVTLKGLPGRPIMSNSDGTYSTTAKYGWKGTITPVKAGYTFDPPEIQYSELFGPETNRDYTASLERRIISGIIRSDKGKPVEGVFILADNDGGSATTNPNGEYELTVDYGWRGMVTPTQLGYNFKPTNKRYAVSITKDQANQAFTAIVQMFTISDAVMVGGTPIVGVQVSANNGGGTATTDSKGRFSVKVPYNWSGEIALSKPGFMFPSKSYTNITEDYKNDIPVSAIPPVRRPTPTPTPTPGPTEPRAIVPDGPEFVGVVPPALPPVPEPNKPLTPIEEIQKALAELLEKKDKVITVVEPNELVPKVMLISNVWVDGDLITILQDIASSAGITIIPDETIMGMVSCTLKDVPLETALDIVLGGTPYIWKKTPYYYLVCSGGIKDTMFSFVSETRRMKMNYVTANAAVGLLSSAFRDYVQSEIGPPGTDTYTVVVTAPPAMMKRIISDLKQIDHIRPAVLLDARIVVMERGNLLNLGVQWGFPTLSFGAFSNDLLGKGVLGMADFGGKMPWGLSIGYTPDATFTNALNLALNLLAQNDEATIVSNPQVLAQDGKTAEIAVMTEEYFFMTEPLSSARYYSYSELEKIESGTKLSITPHIGDNNDITLELAIEVSDSIPRGRESDLPVITRRTSTNTVRIKNGGTVAVGGLTENRTRTDKRRVPGLSKLPFIGSLFKNTNDENSTREIAVFVTATIIPEPGQSIEFAEPSTPTIQAPIQAPIRPMEGDFRMRLRDSLSRPIR